MTAWQANSCPAPAVWLSHRWVLLALFAALFAAWAALLAVTTATLGLVSLGDPTALLLLGPRALLFLASRLA
jgi:hypothetical protein